MRALLIAAVLLMASGLGDGVRAEPVLKPQVTIERDMVRLGDLFAELPPAFDPAIEIARAPAPGQKTTFDASALLAIANSQHLTWRPTGRFDRVVVERAGQVIGAAAIH